ncbi:hypothetical protein GT037_011157 [Alternaria burnsii]|uniref:CCHC-type domain-containing protein n=1 Tax=Alternaria burnsii TaxID=1187904 RepID=A0A8H7AW19_9PLEO|nr:uncharacterized protein GT037_011157 [Alternaria burnsii]KAF7670706.1 hypothetical protein GT037_011157 [Alternaria burnsii]
MDLTNTSELSPYTIDSRVVEETYWVVLEGWNLRDMSKLHNLSKQDELRKQWSTVNQLNIRYIDFRNNKYLIWGFTTLSEAAKAHNKPVYFEGTEAQAIPIDIKGIPVFCRRCCRPGHMAAECGEKNSSTTDDDEWPCLICAKKHRKRGDTPCSIRKCCINCLRDTFGQYGSGLPDLEGLASHPALGHGAEDPACPHQASNEYHKDCFMRRKTPPGYTLRARFLRPEDCRALTNHKNKQKRVGSEHDVPPLTSYPDHFMSDGMVSGRTTPRPRIGINSFDKVSAKFWSFKIGFS